MVGRGPDYQTALAEIVTPAGEADEVALTGVIEQIGLGCEAGQRSCYLNLRHDNLTIQVFYNGGSTELNQCANQTPAAVVAALAEGDRVAVFGRQTRPGTIHLCDSTDYYLKPIE